MCSKAKEQMRKFSVWLVHMFFITEINSPLNLGGICVASKLRDCLSHSPLVSGKLRLLFRQFGQVLEFFLCSFRQPLQ